MKYAVLFTLSGFFATLNAQNDSLLPNLSAIYNIQLFEYDTNLNPIYTYYDLEFVNSDTTTDTVEVYYSLNSALVALLAYSGNQVYVKQFGNFDFDFNMGLGFELLYDYDIQIGDTSYFFHGSPLIVTSIDSINIQGVQRKRITFNNGEDIWMQGMGSILHPFIPKMRVFENAYTVCSATMEYIGPSPIDTNTFFGPCLSAGLSESELNNQLSVYPNPSISDVHFESSNYQIRQIDIFNIEGKRVMQKKCVGFDCELKMVHLDEGIYFYKVIDSNGTTLAGKLVKK